MPRAVCSPFVVGALAVAGVVTPGSPPSSAVAASQPAIVARKAPTLTVDGLAFKDLNRNNALDAYEDWRLPVEARVADLVSKMDLAEKAGLMVHASLMGFTRPGGAVLDAPVQTGPPGGGIRPRPGVYVENMSKDAAGRYGTLVDDPKQADAAIIRVDAPYALHPGGGGFFRGAHEGTLAYAGAENAKELDAIKRLASSGTPTVVRVYMERPPVVSEFLDRVAAVLGHFSSSDEALLDVVLGRHPPTGKLPFNLPRDMASVEKQYPDAPHDLESPPFQFGFGLSYEGARAGGGGSDPEDRLPN